VTNGLPTLIPDIGTEFEFYEPQKTLFMPRLGLAYRPTDDWVLRSGFGISYNVHQLNNYTILNLNPPKSGTSNFTNTSAGGKITNSPTQPVLTFAAPFGTVNPTSATGINALSPTCSGGCRSTSCFPSDTSATRGHTSIRQSS
jgi:hypothetical protein